MQDRAICLRRACVLAGVASMSLWSADVTDEMSHPLPPGSEFRSEFQALTGTRSSFFICAVNFVVKSSLL